MYFNQNFTSKIIASVAKKDSTLRIKDLDNLDLVKFAYGGKVLGSSQLSLLP